MEGLEREKVVIVVGGEVKTEDGEKKKKKKRTREGKENDETERRERERKSLTSPLLATRAVIGAWRLGGAGDEGEF